MPYSIPDTNKEVPITTILKWYLERRRGKVVEAREEIQRRFRALDRNVQKEIIFAFLSSGKEDRAWVYRTITDFWDDAFMDKVKETFEKYHEKGCYIPVIKYFPTKYIIEHIDELSVNQCYCHLCYRLVSDQVDFQPNWPKLLKLSPKEYLTIMKLAGKEISDSKANNILYGVVHIYGLLSFMMSSDPTIRAPKLPLDFCYDDLISDYKFGTPIVPSDFCYVHDIIDILESMGKDHVVSMFYEWEKELYSTILNSDAFKRLKEKEDSRRFGKLFDLSMISKRFIFRMMPEKYKSPKERFYEDDLSYVGKIKDINPALSLLVDKLGLTTTDS